MLVVSASGLGHLLATGQMKGCSQPPFPDTEAGATSTIGLFHCHGPTVPQPQCCFQAGKHSRRHTGGWRWSVASLPSCQHGSKTHFYKVAHMTEQSLPSVCEHWDRLDNNPPSCVCVSRGCPASCHVKVVLLTATQVSLAMLTSQCWLGRVTSCQPRGTPLSMWGTASVVSPVFFLFPP